MSFPASALLLGLLTLENSKNLDGHRVDFGASEDQHLIFHSFPKKHAPSSRHKIFLQFFSTSSTHGSLSLMHVHPHAHTIFQCLIFLIAFHFIFALTF